MRFLIRVQHALEAIVERLGQLGGWILFATVAVVFLNTVDRYAQIALGLAFAWLHRDHIAVDVFSQYYSPKVRDWMEFLVAVVIAIPVSIFLIKISFPYIDRSFQMMEGSPNPGGLPFRWIPKGAVALAFVLLLLEAIATAIRSGMRIFAPGSDPPSRDASQLS